MRVISKMTDDYLNVNTKHKYTIATYLTKYTHINKYQKWYITSITKRLESLELQGMVKQVKSERNSIAWVWR